ncbi:MAG: lptF [Burkholderiales bacterium]|jgi:lipopolysaccharide export system permease protein|nr:lptF [Burkholderiales bacterium]
MLVKKIFYRELVSNASKIFIILVAILPITELFKLLNQAASGSIPTVTLVTLMIYGTIASFPMILTIACFLTVVMTINRYCKDQEFAIWLSSGLSPFYWLRQVTYFIIPMTIICAVSTMYITPWATATSEEYANYLSKQQTAMLISPGVFKENGAGDQVFYLEKYSINPSFAQNIFIQYVEQNGSPYNITAKAGKIETRDGISSVILKNAHRYDLANTGDNIFQLNFDEFKASIKVDYKPRDKSDVGISTSTIKQLYKKNNNNARAEICWRISVAAMMFVMALLVVPISIQIGRVQNSVVFIMPIVMYGIYENSVLTINGYINSGALSSMGYVFIVHIIMIAIAILLTYMKTFPKGYFRSKNK